jgi:ABC-type phosphate/phosphonate transport system substrate-binding protein
MRIACLPWYDLPETEAAQDSLWSTLAGHLRREGMRDVPSRLARGVPVPRVFTDPRLLLGQCCGYDLVYGFAACLSLVATPRYDAPGCAGSDYRSLVLVPETFPADDLEALRGSVCVLNSFNSHSGTNALRALVAPFSRDGRFFSAVKVSGGHVDSLALLRAGEAEVMAMDCVLHALLERHRPDAIKGVRVLGWSEAAPAPPIVTSSAADRDTIRRLRTALASAMSDPGCADARSAMLLDGIDVLPTEAYGRIVEIEASALRRGYRELHATTSALSR